MLQADFEAAGKLLDVMNTERNGTMESKSIGKEFYQPLVQVCVSAQDPIAAGWCVERMILDGAPPSLTSVNAVIRACAKAGNLDLATSWWERLQRLELQPNGFTYNAMVHACAQARKPAMAERWVQRMEQSGLRPCKVTFNALIDAYAKRGKVDEAEAWFRRMQERGVEADKVIYNSLINACAQAGKPSKAALWFEELLAHDFKADQQTYNTLISACAKAGVVEKAEHWFRRMEAEGCKGDVITFGALMHAAARGGNILKAEVWVEEMLRRGLKLNLVCFNTMLHACAQAGDAASARKWFNAMRGAGAEPNKLSYNSMIGVYAEAGDLDTAQAWLCEMVKKNLDVDHVTYMTLLRHRRPSKRNSSDFKEAASWAYSAIVRAHVAVGKREQLVPWTLRMAREGIVLPPRLFEEAARGALAAEAGPEVEATAGLVGRRCVEEGAGRAPGDCAWGGAAKSSLFGDCASPDSLSTAASTPEHTVGDLPELFLAPSAIASKPRWPGGPGASQLRAQAWPPSAATQASRAGPALQQALWPAQAATTSEMGRCSREALHCAIALALQAVQLAPDFARHGAVVVGENATIERMSW